MSETTVLPPPKPQRGMVIRGLIPRLPERGKIKIGGLGQERTTQSGTTRRLPVRYDHFVITTMERGKDGNFVRDEQMHQKFGDHPTSIPIRLLYDDPTLNFPTRYAAFQGRRLWCTGDGAKAMRLNKDGNSRHERTCTCELADPTISRRANEIRCKMNGALSVLIEGASGLGGVWTFRTTSFNSITGLLSTMSFLRTVTGGPLANIPLSLKIQPRQAANPVDGTSVTIHMVVLEYEGDTESLQKLGHQVALMRAQTHLSITHIEEEARRVLLLTTPKNAPLSGDDDKIVDEFYPEQVTTVGVADQALEEFAASGEPQSLDGIPSSEGAGPVEPPKIKLPDYSQPLEEEGMDPGWEAPVEEPPTSEEPPWDEETVAKNAGELMRQHGWVGWDADENPVPPPASQDDQPYPAPPVDPPEPAEVRGAKRSPAFWKKERLTIAPFAGDAGRTLWPETADIMTQRIKETESLQEMKRLTADNALLFRQLKAANQAKYDEVTNEVVEQHKKLEQKER